MGTRPLLLRFLSIHDILAWSATYHRDTGKRPTKPSSGIAAARFETWAGMDAALRQGVRGLPVGNSLARLLAGQCGVRNIQAPPPLSAAQILRWADEHHRRTGAWPTARQPDTIPGSGGEKRAAIDHALRKGTRGLPGGLSLARFLAQHRDVRNRKQLPPLSEGQIMLWADAHFRREGSWPTRDSGPVADAPGETWLAADMALRKDRRGLPGGSSLPLLLAERRGVCNTWSLPALTVEQILAWADAFHTRTESWPHPGSGPIPEAEGETWNAIGKALKRGSRGLPGGFSLAELLARERGGEQPTQRPRPHPQTNPGVGGRPQSPDGGLAGDGHGRDRGGTRGDVVRRGCSIKTRGAGTPWWLLSGPPAGPTSG
jgi:hypothetical protein